MKGEAPGAWTRWTDRTGEVWSVPGGGWVMLVVGRSRDERKAQRGLMHPIVILDKGWSKGRDGQTFEFQEAAAFEDCGWERLA